MRITNSKHSVLGVSPFYALYGYNPTVHYEVEDDFNEGKVPSARERIKTLHNLQEKLAEHLEKAAETQAKYYNRKHEPKRFKLGDLVLLSTKELNIKEHKRKLAPKYCRPFRIVKVVGSQAYKLALPTDSRVHNVFHVARLEPYVRRDVEGEGAFYACSRVARR